MWIKAVELLYPIPLPNGGHPTEGACLLLPPIGTMGCWGLPKTSRDELQNEWKQHHGIRIVGQGEMEKVFITMPRPPMLS